MTRAALCVMGADPFLDAYWIRHFRSWADQVDELRVVFCGVDDQAHRALLRAALWDLPASAEWMPLGTDHGVAIREGMQGCRADVVMLCEEDAYVCKPGMVGEQFARIERGEADIVGGPRGTMTPELRSWANAKYGELTGQTGEAGPILWPCFLWARRADLERTDQHYGAIGWEPGARILGETYPERQSADTFGWASLQLRELGLRVHVEAQYRADFGAMAGWSDPPWFHVGGLSTGWGMYVMGPDSHDPSAMRDQDLTDWTKRVAWWQRMAEKAPGPPGLAEPYRASVDRLVSAMGMDREQIAAWDRAFGRLVTWPET